MSSPSPFMPTPCEITDLQYAVYRCGLPLEMVARRTGMTVPNLMRELHEAPLPDWLVASVNSHHPNPRGPRVELPSMS